MTEIKQDGKAVEIKFDTEKLGPNQIRLLKSINALLAQVVATEDEGVFFESSAELMRTCASLIQQSRFAETLIHMDDIPYAEQALEYSLELLQEHMSQSNVVNYDC